MLNTIVAQHQIAHKECSLDKKSKLPNLRPALSSRILLPIGFIIIVLLLFSVQKKVFILRTKQAVLMGII